MQGMKKIFLLVLLAVIGIATLPSCKKETPNAVPEITVTSPAEGAQFNVFDTIRVTFATKDKEGLAQYSVVLCNNLLVPVQQAVNSALTGNAANVDFLYVIDNVQLADGDYYLLFAVQDDGGNIEKVYRHIYITSLPQVRRGFYLVGLPNSNLVNLTRVDSAWNITSGGSFTGDYSASCINNHWQQFYICGKQTGPFYAVDITNGGIAWQRNPLPSPGDFYTHAACMNDYVYISYRDDAVQGFDRTGALRFGTNITNGFYPIKTLFFGNRLYAEQKDPGGPSRKLVMYNGSTGTGMQETLLTGEVVGLFEKDASNIYVVSNTGSQGKLQIYDVTANGLWEPITLPAGKVLDAAAVDNNTLLISMDNGTVYKFTYSPLGLLTTLSGVTAHHLRFDPLQSEIITSTQNQLRVFDYGTGTPEQTVAVADSIAGFEVWYNR